MLTPCHFLKMALVLALIIILMGCEGGKVADPAAFKAQLSEVPDSAWKSLSEKRIFFGHQSVGDNIMAGIGDIQTWDSRIKLKISKLEAATALEKPGFYHSHIGRNEDPKSKVDDFAEKMENGLGNSADIAFFKFCYIDVNPSTDVAGSFQILPKHDGKPENQIPAALPSFIALCPLSNCRMVRKHGLKEYWASRCPEWMIISNVMSIIACWLRNTPAKNPSSIWPKLNPRIPMEPALLLLKTAGVFPLWFPDSLTTTGI